MARGQTAEARTARRGEPDYVLLSAALMLVVLGLIAVFSSSYAVGVVNHGDANYFIKRQAIWAAIGLAGLVVAMSINYRLLMRRSPLVMLAAIAGLGAVFVSSLGVSAEGSARWISVGPITAQPSEFAKLAVIIYLAAWLAAKGPTVRNFALGVAPYVGMVGLVTALVLLEPDLGTATTIALITGTLLFVSGARLLHIAALVASATVFTGALVIVGGYGAARILSFTSAESDPEGIGFQTLQMLQALGSGGLTGLGLGVSRQKFFYVPASHTDGVLAIIGEELGYIGVVVVLALFALLLWRGLLVMQRAADPFGSLLAAGVLAWLAFQMLINVGGITRSIPLTGIPLPLVSYGGSSLMMTMIAIGLLLSVSRYAHLGDPELEPPTRGVLRAPGLRRALLGRATARAAR
ncbi:MAG: putative lipid II flippase FtsW [Chloroflexi bacterium]|nr:putative lipid II flippase FtsW [Chloroflexota bacterium]